MNIPKYSELEISKIYEACRLAVEVLEMIGPFVKEGISTGELDRICSEFILKNKALSACLNYNDFPKSICTSINDVICHGIPDDKKKLKKGDIINIDVTVNKNGFFGDSSKMFVVEEPNIRDKRLIGITQQALYVGIREVKAGVRLQNIGKAIQKFVEQAGFSVVREYCGHGIGRQFHHEPQVIHYYGDDEGVILEPGMIFTIEPMINAGRKEVRLMGDGWTVKTKDRSHSAQFEHQILVTEKGCRILTIRDEEIKEGHISEFMEN